MHENAAYYEALHFFKVLIKNHPGLVGEEKLNAKKLAHSISMLLIRYPALYREAIKTIEEKHA